MTIEKTRLPRGTHVVANAFLAAVDTIASERRQEVATAALRIVKAGLADRKAESRVKAKAPAKSAAPKRIPAKPATKATGRQKSSVGKVHVAKPKLVLVATKARTAAAA